MTMLLEAIAAGLLSTAALTRPEERLPADATRPFAFDAPRFARLAPGDPLPPDFDAIGGRGLRVVARTEGESIHLMLEDPEIPSRHASLLLREDRLTGAIHLDSGHCNALTGVRRGVARVELRDAMREPDCVAEVPMHGAREGGTAATCDSGARVDLLVLYTDAALAQAGGLPQMLDWIHWAVADSNAIFAASRIGLTMRLVGAKRAPGYTEDPTTIANDLHALQDPADGLLDLALPQRNASAADLVALIRADGSGPCGISYLLGTDAADEAFAYSVTALGCLTSRTFIHELGHNMGCCHAPGDGGGCTTGGIFSYAVGHRFTGGDGAQYRTVMAYAPGTRIPYFSSATATFSGVTTGIADTRDNARTITETRMVTSNFRCEVTPSGAGSLARCWGANDRGQSTVASSLARVERVAAGSLHSVASLADGTVACWGSNDYGQCTPPATLPAVADVDAGVRHTMALTRGGAVVCWGANEYGQSTPPSGLGTVSSIASGGYHCLAILEIGSVRAWGQNNYGQATVPASVTSALSIGAGASHSLAVKADGSVAGWGRNDKAQASVPAGLAACTAVAGGDLHSLALRSTGTVAAWGNNPYGQCTVPADLAGVVAVAAGTSHSVALTSAGLVRGWGRDHLGQVTVPAGVEQITEIDSGSNHVIAVMRTADCNGNGVSDAFDIATGMSDADADGRIDACEMAQGDMDLSGEIDFGDVALVLLDYGPCAGCPTDLDGTGEVDFGDVGLVLLNFGPTS